MTNKEYINKFKDEDVRSLALRKVPEGVDASYCLTQVEGYQLAKKKLPIWADTDGIIFPPRLSMEQCSSELTARYKSDIVERLGAKSIVDLTGGFGVDFSYMARDCEHAIYVERQETLCAAARNNIPLLGLQHAVILNTSAEEAITQLNHADLIFLDPARRDDCGRKVAAIGDCSPNMITLQDILLDKSDYVIVKLSPMLDITQAMRQLHHVTEVHVVSVRNECKELLFVLSKHLDITSPTFYCINILSQNVVDSFSTGSVPVEKENVGDSFFSMPKEGEMLIEPNVSILKAGLQDAFAKKYGLMKLHPLSHLYVSSKKNVNVASADTDTKIPGRRFKISAIGVFSKASIKQLVSDINQANITIRNFPSTVSDLRKRLKIKEGGNEYLFATTLLDNSHALIRCEKL